MERLSRLRRILQRYFDQEQSSQSAMESTLAKVENLQVARANVGNKARVGTLKSMLCRLIILINRYVRPRAGLQRPSQSIKYSIKSVGGSRVCFAKVEKTLMEPHYVRRGNDICYEDLAPDLWMVLAESLLAVDYRLRVS